MLMNFTAISQDYKFLNENNLSGENTSKNFYYDVFNLASFLIEGQYCKDVEILANVPIEVRRHPTKACLFGFKINRSEQELLKILFFRDIHTKDTLKELYLSFEEQDYIPKIFINNTEPSSNGCFSIYTDSVISYIPLAGNFNNELRCEVLEYDITAESRGKIIYQRKSVKGAKLPIDLQKKLNTIASPQGALIIENVKIKVGNNVVLKKEKTMIGSCFF